MPTNLPADYYDIEERYRAAGSPAEKIIYIEEMLSVIPKHKGTDKLRADLRKRMSKFKTQTDNRKGGSSSRQVSPYHIDNEGAGRIAVIGPPNVGKSSLVTALTNASPEIAAYPFTTRAPLPGMMMIDNVQVQLIDTPPLNPDLPNPQLIDLIRRSDLVLLVVDLQAYPISQFQDTLALLEERRIAPNIYRDRYDEERRMRFKPFLALVNKVDDAQFDEEFEVLCELLEDAECPLMPISATTGRNLEEQLKPRTFDKLKVVRIYSKPPGKEPDRSAPFVLKQGGTVGDFAEQIHKDFGESLKSARVWGAGVFDGQTVGRDHVLHDEDVVELRM
jgi:uncharacterized protein